MMATEEIELPLEIKGRWLRFKERIPFGGRKKCKTAPCVITVGIKGTGKSSLTENIGTHFPKIIDLFGSRDNEGLAWLRSPYKDSVLLIGGDSVDVSSHCDFKNLKDVRISDFRKYRVILSVSAFYNKVVEEHHMIKTIMDKLWKRTHWDEPWFLAIREAANLIYSRITIGDDQAKAKAYFIYVLREARHMGLAIGADAIRFRSIDIDLRSIADYTLIKACGIYGLPSELRFLYSFFIPTGVAKMPPHRFIIVTKNAAIGRGAFQYPPWHKEEREDLLKEFDIQIERGDPIFYGDGDDRKPISDFEHDKMIRLRIEKANPETGKFLSINKIAEIVSRSVSSVNQHRHLHNDYIKDLGECVTCKKLRSEYSKTKV